MSSKVLFVVYDNGSFDNTFPMGVGALAAILKQQGHKIALWNQDIHHYSDNSLTENTANEYIELQEIQILQGTRFELKNRICSLLFAYLNIETQTKELIDTTYEDIMKKVNRARESEKERIFSYFDNMKPERRKVEDTLKKYKLGRWNIGLQKSIFQYDKKTYDQDGFENENIDEVNTEVDINQLNSNDDEAIEAIDINHLGTNFTDGAFYEEDQDFDE